MGCPEINSLGSLQSLKKGRKVNLAFYFPTLNEPRGRQTTMAAPPPTLPTWNLARPFHRVGLKKTYFKWININISIIVKYNPIKKILNTGKINVTEYLLWIYFLRRLSRFLVTVQNWTMRHLAREDQRPDSFLERFRGPELKEVSSRNSNTQSVVEHQERIERENRYTQYIMFKMLLLNKKRTNYLETKVFKDPLALGAT